MGNMDENAKSSHKNGIYSIMQYVMAKSLRIQLIRHAFRLITILIKQLKWKAEKLQ